MTPETRDKARRIADLAFGEADYGTVVDAIANAISSATPKEEAAVSPLIPDKGQDIVEFIQSRYHDVFDDEAHYSVKEMDAVCTEIATLRIDLVTAERRAQEEAADLIVSLRKELEEVRVKALEEAALLIDNCEYADLVYPETMSDERDNIAAAIRDLKDKQP